MTICLVGNNVGAGASCNLCKNFYRITREVIHRLRGYPSSKKINRETEDKIKKLYEEKYFGFNISHFTEYLNEEEGIKVSREWVKKLLRKKNLS
jgi:transposase